MNSYIKKALKLAVILLALAFAVLILSAIYQKQLYDNNNQPIWSSLDSTLNLDGMKVDIDGDITLEIEKGTLTLVRKEPLRSQILLKYKDRYWKIDIYLKDLDQNGQHEMVLLFDDDKGGKDLYIFSHLAEEKVRRYIGKDLAWTGDKLLFDNSDNLYVRSCGSQYCNDTYYLWIDGQLKEEYTDTYESM